MATSKAKKTSTTHKTSATKKKSPYDTRKMNPVVHFEFPAEDRKRISKFYASAFGWKTEQLGPEMGNYVTASTCETKKTGSPKELGMINGGFYTKDDNQPEVYPSVVIAVADINKAMKKIEKAGGEIIGDPMEIQGIGMMVSFYDSEGNRNSIMEPIMK